MTAVLARVKAPHSVFGNDPNIRRLADLRWNKLKVALAEVCHLHVMLF